MAQNPRTRTGTPHTATLQRLIGTQQVRANQMFSRKKAFPRGWCKSSASTPSGPSISRKEHSQSYLNNSTLKPSASTLKPSINRSEHLQSYLNDSTLKPSTRRVSEDDTTYDTIFQTTAGHALILRVHFPPQSSWSSKPLNMMLFGVRATHDWLDSYMRVIGYQPITSASAWVSSGIKLGRAVNAVVHHFRFNPPNIIEFTSEKLKRIQSQISQRQGGASNSSGDGPPPDDKMLGWRERAPYRLQRQKERRTIEGDSVTHDYKTRASLDAAILSCENDLAAVKGEGRNVNMTALKNAQKAQARLKQLLPLRKKLFSAEELREIVRHTEAKRDAMVGDGNFDAAMELQWQVDDLGSKLQAEENEMAFEEGRRIMLHAIDNGTTGPEPVPFEYLNECTAEFSDDRRLGEGAFSEVFLGKDEVLRRKFAVKRLRVSLQDGSDIKQARRTFQREIMTSRHFRHPNIARLYAYFLSSDLTGMQCLVFELAAKGSLDILLKEKEAELHFSTRVSIALDVSKALRYLHSGTPVCFHRDVKAANICLRRDNCALLIDTGVSKMLPAVESNSTMTLMETTGAGIRGTRGYICPYYARTMQNFTTASEVFSLGIVLAELFTGILQNSRFGGEDIDHFDWFSNDGMLSKTLEDYVDKDAGVWPTDLQQRFCDLTVEMIHIRPGKRPTVHSIVEELGTLASQARQWSPGDRNHIKVLSSAPLVWKDSEGNINPITSSLDFAAERDLLTQCIKESKRDIKLSFDPATDDRFLAAATSRCGCLHFSGHGSPHYLLLEDGSGGAHFLGSSDLYDRVHKEPFQFVFVSACCSALMGNAFINAGVPHVVCCDHNEDLSDDAALKFAHSFYFALAEGYTIQASFTKGQQAVAKRFGSYEEGKFLLLPEHSNHEKPLFVADIIQWDDSARREKYIPAPPSVFLGRETDMYLLLQALVTKQFVTLTGVKGVGCSSLAAAVCHYVDERRTTILSIQDVYFVRADKGREATTQTSFIRPLQKQLVAEGKMSEPHGWSDLPCICEDICIALKGSCVLLVFDGIDVKDEGLPDIINSLFKMSSTIKLLITAPSPIDSPIMQVHEHVVRLSPLDLEGSALLFGEFCPYCDTPSKKQALCAKLVRESTEGSLAHQRAFLGMIRGGIPSNIINAAKNMTMDEYKLLQDENTSSR